MRPQSPQMDPTDISLAIGWPLAAVTAASTLFASVIEESLKLYHRSELFDSLAQEKHAQFEDLLKREQGHFVAARMGRLAALVFFFGACLILMAAYRSPFVFELSDLINGTAITLGAAVLLGGLVPAIWAKTWAEPTLRRLLPFFALISLPLRPLVALIGLLERGVARVAGEEVAETKTEEFEDDFADQLDEAARDGVIGEGERKMIDSIIEFSRDTVLDAMIPRTEMVTVDVDDTVEHAVDVANRNGHSRLPVVDGSRDAVVGIFNLRDATAHWKSRNGSLPPLKDIMRPAAFVPESKKLSSLLAEFKTNRNHLVIVLDEFGGTSGLVTLEDVIEEIVGEIEDEHDDADEGPDALPNTATVAVDGEGLEIDARTKIDDLNAALDSSLPESPDYTSIGGLISARTGRIPSPGEEVPIGDLIFRVVDASERAVKKVSVKRVPSSDTVAAED